MKPTWEQGEVKLYRGDCLTVLPTLPGSSVSSIVTDPPYGLSFMGKQWDRGVPGLMFWEAALRVAKPGAFLLAFGGTRTSHRLVSAIEDAGWEIRDGMIWLYAQGFCKNHNISKAIDKAAGAEREVVGPDPYAANHPNPRGAIVGQNYGTDLTPARPVTAPATDAAKEWDGYGTALSPSHEPICVAMKPLDGTFAQNAIKHGVAGLNIDGARIPTGQVKTRGRADSKHGKSNSLGDKWSGNVDTTPHARWPKNVILSDDPEVAAIFPETNGDKRGACKGTRPGGFGNVGANPGDGEPNATVYDDSGSVSRYFYTAKAGKTERRGSNHPTVKPLALIEYLCRLTMTPTGGVVLDPFLGQGTSAEACIRLGRPFIGIELDSGYFDDAVSRVKLALKEDREQPALFTMKPEPPTQQTLWSER